MAKRFLRLLCVSVIFSVFILSGCVSSDSQNSVKALITDFTADFTAQYNSSEYRGTVTTNRQGMMTIDITYPETIEGLRVKYTGTELLLSRESLVCSADEAYLPDSSFPSVLKSVFKGVAEGRTTLVSCEDDYIYNLKVTHGNATITAAENIITKAEIKDIDFCVEFSNIRTVQ